MKKTPKILVVIPTYNEKGNIERLIPAVISRDEGVCVLIIDDNSPDGTGLIVDSFAKDNPDKVFTIHRSGKLGFGTAEIQGWQWALNREFDAIISMDADFSHSPDIIPILIETGRTYDFVIGSRYIRGGKTVNWGLYRRALSKFGNLLAKTVLGLPTNDLTTGFRLITRNALEKLDMENIHSEGYAFLIETSYRIQSAGFKTKEVPITFVDRVIGSSKISKKIIFEALNLLRKLWTEKRKQKKA